MKLITFLSFLSFAIDSLGQELFQKITFLQGDSSYIVFIDNDSIKIERKPFSVRFFCKKYEEKNEKFYSVQVAILDECYDTLLLKVGQKTINIPFFEPGTGMAPGENNMYDSIFISNEGHHYLTYENDKEKRVFLISSNENILELEWKIFGAFYRDNSVSFSDLKLPFLYFIVFADRNLNGIIDNNELKKIKVVFK